MQQDLRGGINLKVWEAILLVLCVTGGFFIAYFFGFRAGHSVGYEDARTAELNNSTRFAVFEDVPANLSDKDLDQVYERLHKSLIDEKDNDTDKVEKETELSGVAAINEEKEVTPTPTPTRTPKATPTPKSTPKTTPTPKPTPVPTKEPASFAKPPDGWYVQVATIRNAEEAKKLSKSLYSTGFASEVEIFKLGNETYYRVLVGPETSKEYADRLVEQLGREKYLSGAPFIRKIE